MLFMAEEHPSRSGKLGEWSAESGSSGVAGAVYEAPLKQWGLVGIWSGAGRALGGEAGYRLYAAGLLGACRLGQRGIRTTEAVRAVFQG